MKKNSIGYYIIASAIIWGLTILGCALKLEGTDCYKAISGILSTAAAMHLILIWGTLTVQLKKQREKSTPESEIKE